MQHKILRKSYKHRNSPCPCIHRSMREQSEFRFHIEAQTFLYPFLGFYPDQISRFQLSALRRSRAVDDNRINMPLHYLLPSLCL